MNKFRAVPVVLNNIRFASKKEANRYLQLSVLQRAGQISNLTCHPKFPLVVNGVRVCTYIADFSYTDADGSFVVEDVKSRPTITAIYRLKKKLLQAVHGISVLEVL